MTERNMAYKFVKLLGELNILLDISCMILNIKKLQAKLFIENVGEVLRILEMEGTPNFPEQLVEETLPLALPIGDFIKGPGLRIVRSSVAYIMPTYRVDRELETELPARVLEEIGLIENKVQKFLDESDLYNVWEDLRNNLALLPSRVVVRDLLQASQELKESINFFHEVFTESAALFQYLWFLRTFLKTSQRECSHELVEGIRDVVEKAHDAVKRPDKDRLSSQMRMFEEDVLLVRRRVIQKQSLRGMKHFEEVKVVENDAWLDSGFISIKENCFEKQARNFFDGKNGMRLVLLDTLGKVHSFKGEIDMITKALGKNCLQPWNPSFDSLQLFSYSSNVPKERKKAKSRVFQTICMALTLLLLAKLIQSLGERGYYML